AAAAEDDSSAVEVGDPVVVTHAHAARVTTVILQDGGNGGTVTDLDAHLFRGREPAPREANTFVRGAHNEAARPDDLVALAHTGEAGGRLPAIFARAVLPKQP